MGEPKQGLVMKYFVLKPAGDHAYARASRVAMLAYAKWIAEENPELAAQLQDWVAQENAESYARSIQPSHKETASD